MRLLNAQSLELTTFFGDETPPYAILSHTWGKDEVTFDDVQCGSFIKKHGYKKMSYTLHQAREDNLEWAWIDTCCIDKSSSSELQEAINSMFGWYRGAQTCYAYLEDVQSPCPGQSKALRGSRWFKRGWTLQELIAPREVRFFDLKWQLIGQRDALAGQLTDITGIDTDILSGPHLSISWALRGYSIAQRISWAANRQTTRPEDRAYSLLGLLGVSMPLLYGEGLGAFKRLQEEVIKTSSDLSIFAWGSYHTAAAANEGNLMAESPDDFRGCGDIVVVGQAKGNTRSFLEGEASLTNLALHVMAPVLVVDHVRGALHGQLALSLQCRRKGDITNVIALSLTPDPGRRHPAAEAMKQSTIEAMCQTGSERITFVDSISAEANSKLKSVVIRRTADQFPLADREAMISGARTLDYVWVRFSTTSIQLDASTLDAGPSRYWSLPSPCFDIQAARDDHYRLQRKKSSGTTRLYGDSTTFDSDTVLVYPPIYSFITLRIQNLGNIVVAFGYFNGKLDFSLAWTQTVALGPSKKYRLDDDALPLLVRKACHTLRTDDNRVVHIKLLRRNVLEESVGILDISVLENEGSGPCRNSANVKG